MKKPAQSRPQALLLAVAAALAGSSAQAVVSYEVMDVGVLPGYTAAYGLMDVNGSGQVAGSSAAGGFARAFRFSNGILTDLGSPFPANVVVANGINNHGDVVGSIGSNGYDATLWKSDGSMSVLGDLPGGSWSVARKINDAGQIEGLF